MRNLSLINRIPVQVGAGDIGETYRGVSYQKGYGFGKHSIQRGGGMGGTYRGVHMQRGHGMFGSILSSLWRRIVPYIKPVAKVLKGQALTTTSNILSDVVAGNNVVNSIKNRSVEGVQDMLGIAKTKLDEVIGGEKPQEGGGGYKRWKSGEPASNESTAKRRRSSFRKSVLPYSTVFD